MLKYADLNGFTTSCVNLETFVKLPLFHLFICKLGIITVQQKHFYPSQSGLIVGLLIEKIKVGNHKNDIQYISLSCLTPSPPPPKTQWLKGNRYLSHSIRRLGGSSGLSQLGWNGWSRMASFTCLGLTWDDRVYFKVVTHPQGTQLEHVHLVTVVPRNERSGPSAHVIFQILPA